MHPKHSSSRTTPDFFVSFIVDASVDGLLLFGEMLAPINRSIHLFRPLSSQYSRPKFNVCKTPRISTLAE